MDKAKTPNKKGSAEKKAVTPTMAQQEEVVFAGDTPLSMANGDLNSSAWAMMGDSDDFDWGGNAIGDEDGIALLNASLISLNESQDATELPPKTPARGSKGPDTPQVCYDEWNRNSPTSRLVGSSRAVSLGVPGKGSPFDTFRLNSTYIAVDETCAYETKIKELEEALEEERAQRKTWESNVQQSFQTPAPVRGTASSTPVSAMRNGLDADSLYARNQTLVKEVRFAEQTCIEVSNEKQNLMKQADDLQAEVETLRKENQSFQARLTSLDREKATAESLESSWKSRVTELESLLSSAEAEKASLQKKYRELEENFRETQQKAAKDTNTASNREGKLIRAILDQEKLSKDLKAAREKYKLAEERAKALENINGEREEALQIELEKCRKQTLEEENELSETRRRNDAAQMRHLETELELQRDVEVELRTELNQAQEVNNGMLLQIEELRECLSRQKEESSESAQAERHRLFSQLQNLESELQRKVSDLLESQSKVETLTMQLSEATTHQREAAHNLDQESANLRKELSKLTAESESLREALHEAESKLMAERSEMESLQLRLQEPEIQSEGQGELKSLRLSLEESENKRLELQQEFDSISRTQKDLENGDETTSREMESLRQALKESENEKLELQSSAKSLRQSIEVLERTKDAAKEETELSIQSLKECESKLEASLADCEELSNQYTDERDKCEHLEQTLSKIRQGQGSDVNGMTLQVESLHTSLKLKAEEVEKLSQRCNQVEAQLVEATEECNRLLEFKGRATDALQKFPAQMDSFCNKMEELINSRTDPMGDQIQDLALLASHLRSAIVFEQDWEVMEDNPARAINMRDSLEVESATITDIYQEEGHSNGSPTPLLPYETNGHTSPNQTMNLELMEEARSTNLEYTDERGREGENSDESDSLSTIAGLSHLYSEDRSPESEKGCHISALSGEPTTGWKEFVEESHELHSLKNRISELTEELQVLSMSLRGAQLERDLLKETLKNANKGAIVVDKSGDTAVPDDRSQEALPEGERLEMEIQKLQNCIQTLKDNLEDAERKAKAEKQNAQKELDMLRCEADWELEKLRGELDCKTEALDENIRDVDRLTEKCDQLRHEVENKSHEMERLSCLLGKSKAEALDLKNMTEQLETATESKDIETVEKTSDLKSELERLSALYEESKAQVTDLQNMLEQLESENVETKDKRKHAEHELERLTRLYEESTAESRDLQVKLDKFQQAIELDKVETEEVLDNADHELGHLSKLLEESEAERRNLQDKLQQLQQDYQVEKDGLKAELDRKEKELEDQVESVARLTQQNQGNTAEKSRSRKIAERLQSELSVLNLTIDKLASELEDARDETSRFRRQSDEKDIQIMEVQTRLDAALKETDHAAKELTRMKSDVDKLLQKNGDLQSANRDMISVAQDNRRLSQKLDLVTTERNRFNDDLEFAKVRMSKLEKEVADLRSQKNDLTLALQETHESMRGIESEVESTRMRLAKVHAENASLRSCDRSRQQERDEIEAQLKSKMETEQERQDRDSAKISELSSTNRDLAFQIEALERQKESLVNELDALYKSMSSAQTETASFEERLGAVSEEKEKLKVSYNECNERLVALSKALDEAKESVKSSENCQRAAEELAEDAEQRVSTLRGDCTVLEKECKALRAEAEKKEETIHSLQHAASATSKRVEELEKALEAGQLRMEEAEKRTEELSATCHTLESEKAELLTDREALRSNMKFAEALVAESEQEIENTKSELTRVMDELQSKEKEISSLKREAEALENLVQSTEDRYLECRNIMSKSEVERDSLREELGSTRDHLSETEKKFDLVSTELEKVLSEKEQATAAFEKTKTDLLAAQVIAKDSEARLYRARNEIGTLVAQRDALKSTSAELAEAHEKLEKSTAESRIMQKDIADYREYLAQAQGRIHECTESQRKLQEEVCGATQERDALKSECEKLQKHYQEASQSAAKAREQLVDAQENFNIPEFEITALQQRLTNSEDRCGGLESEVSQLYEMLDQKDARVHELEKKCKGLRQYTRKVAKKCDGWEVYFENQNGIGEDVPNGRH